MTCTRALAVSALLSLFIAPYAKSAIEWKPIDPADLALKAPRVEKDADAEAIFWEVWVMDEAQGGDPRAVVTNYIRIKVFTDRGRESQSTIDLPFLGKNRISDIAGRTIKPDGTIIELKKDAVYERMVVKSGGFKVKAKSFAMPGVESGAIIEYRWKEFRQDQFTNYVRLQFQREIPVQSVIYHIKPFANPYFPYGMRSMPFHCNITPFVREKDGFFTTTMTGAPAFREEPRMPPEDQVRAWMLVYYSEDKKLKADKFWKDVGKEAYRSYKPSMKVNDDVRRIASAAIGDAKTDDEKIARLFDYCRTHIKNIRNENVSSEEREDTRKNKTPADTLKQGAGTGFDIDMAFAALATAAGFDARPARLADRGETFFDPAFTDTYFLRTYNIAVQIGDKWKFYDPGTTYVPAGMLRWQEEGQQALVSDPKDPEFVQTQFSPPEKSMHTRRGTFKLADDGTLEGDVVLEYTGHVAASRKANHDGQSDAERQEDLKQIVKNQMSTAEVSDTKIENATDPEKALIYRYHVRIPGFAQRTGKRLFVQPAYFQFNEPALFATSTRQYGVYFHYAWMEDDMVIIELPAGYVLDHPEAPGAFKIGDLGRYDGRLSITKDNKLLLRRQLVFGNNGKLIFPKETYPQLKVIFDEIYKKDNLAVTLKQDAGPKP
jgi:hypothetical protein